MDKDTQNRIEKLAAYWDTTEAPDTVYIKVAEEESSQTVTYEISLPKETSDRLRKTAKKLNLKPENLAKKWILEKINTESKHNKTNSKGTTDG